ncbi:hypothetical protein DR64_5613 [Paraburkholderia xenovorans LB400]|jgi:hypothetical protein|nr:hypothetical protein [Paraburkholderia xenovorans]AIP37606.1 hypothetical protein DR64_5613 [Paraburkholderia xenovorans LB400]
MLSLIALGQPDIKQYMSMTYDPIDQASRQFGEETKPSWPQLAAQ